jgi:phosphate/sulfate permease
MAFMDEQMQIESQIGFYWGIMLSVIASLIAVIFFTNMAWYFKLFAAIGQFSIMGMIGFGLYNAIKTRRRYLEAKKEMESYSKDKVLKELKGGKHTNGI